MTPDAHNSFLNSPRLELALQTYAVEALRRMDAKLCPDHVGAKGDKAAVIKRLIPRIRALRGQATRKVDLPPASRALLGMVAVMPVAPLASHVASCLLIGHPVTGRDLIALVEEGWIVLDAARGEGVVSLSAPHLGSMREVYTTIAPELDVQPPLPQPLPLPAAPPSRITSVLKVEPAQIVAAVMDALAHLSNKAWRVTQEGELHAAQYQQLKKALGLTTRELPLGMVVRLVCESDLVVEDEANRQLEFNPASGWLEELRANAIVGKLMLNFLATERWADDVPGRDADELFNHLRTPSYAWPLHLGDLSADRLAITTLVGRLPPQWCRVGDVVDLVLQIAPDILSESTARRGYYWSGVSMGAEAKRSWIAAVLMRTLLAFGVVEVARTTDPNAWPTATPYREEGPLRGGRRVAPPPQTWEDCYIRRTRLGDALFSEQPPPPPPSTPSLKVMPDFEILVHRSDETSTLRVLLELMARAEAGHPSDHVVRYRLDRERFTLALRLGAPAEALTELLRAHSSAPLPPNVMRTLEDWRRGFGVVTLSHHAHLLEYPSEAARSQALTSDRGLRPVGERWALGLGEVPATARVMDVTRQPPRCLTWSLNGELTIDTAEADLAIRHVVAQLTEPTRDKGPLRIVADRVKASPLEPAALLQKLGQYSTNAPPLWLGTCLRGWKGQLSPLTHGVVHVVAVSDTELFKLAVLHPDLRPLVRGVLPPSLWVIDTRDTDKIEGVLTRLGVSLGGRLSPMPLPASPR